MELNELFLKKLEECRVANYYPTYSESVSERTAADKCSQLAAEIAIGFARSISDADNIEELFNHYIQNKL
jgi:hypothetical protein